MLIIVRMVPSFANVKVLVLFLSPPLTFIGLLIEVPEFIPDKNLPYTSLLVDICCFFAGNIRRVQASSHRLAPKESKIYQLRIKLLSHGEVYFSDVMMHICNYC